MGKTSEEDQRYSSVSVHVPKVIEARDEIQMAPESRESSQTLAVLMSEDVVRKECECQQEIDRLQERIRKLEEQRGVDLLLPTRTRDFIPDFQYQTLISLYNFLKPRLGFSLNYYNGYSNVSKHPSNVVSRGRPRKLCDIDELFLTMARLRLGLLEKDLADRFNIAQQEVSEIFATWIDRMSDCLGQLSFTTEREAIKRNLPKCFKPDYKDVYLIIDCTELYIENPSQAI